MADAIALDGFRMGFATGSTLLEAAKSFAETLPKRTLTIRRDFMDMSEEERTKLADALNQLWDANLIQEHATFHGQHFYAGIHWGPTFLPWHRYFLRRLEKKLQDIDPSLFLPYWDWTRNDSRSLSAEPWLSFFGGRQNKNGQFDHWSYRRGANPNGTLPTLDDVVQELNVSTFTDFRRMEGGTHVPGHRWIGGDMATGSSPIDPIFYFHHCNLDRLWAIWQANHPNADQYDTTGRIPTDIRDETDGQIDSRVKEDQPMKGIAGESPTPGAFLNSLSVGHGYAQDARLEQHWTTQGHNPPLITNIS